LLALNYFARIGKPNIDLAFILSCCIWDFRVELKSDVPPLLHQMPHDLELVALPAPDGHCFLLIGIANDVLDRQAQMRIVGSLTNEWTAHELVFTTRTGRPVEPRNLARSFDRIITRGGLRPIRLHDLRHTTATLLKNLGVSLRDTMEILGHARIAVTMEIYTSADGTSRRDAIGKLSQLLGTTSAGALLSLLLSISTWSLLPRQPRSCDLGGPRWT
jgi:Phage integrase family